MQQIYRKTLMPKCDFNKVTWNHISAWVFFCQFAAYFHNISWYHGLPYFKKYLRGCSYENSFPIVFSLTWEKDIISSRSYMYHFPAWARFILASCWVGKIWRKANIQNGWHKLPEKWLSFVAFEDTRACFSFCLVRVLSLLDTQRQHRTFVFFCFCLLSRQKTTV